MPSADITKRAIADTMKTLMAQKPLARISVADIAGECGMTRNSFYYHFKDKYDLVNWIFYTELTHALKQKESQNPAPWELLEEICTYFYNNKAFYQNALTVTGQNSFAEYFDELLQKWVQVRMAELYADDEDRDFCTTFFSTAFVANVTRWLTGGAPIPPDKFTRLVRKAATGAALRLVDAQELR